MALDGIDTDIDMHIYNYKRAMAGTRPFPFSGRGPSAERAGKPTEDPSIACAGAVVAPSGTEQFPRPSSSGMDAQGDQRYPPGG